MNISPEAMASLISSSGSPNFGNSLLGMFHENLGIIACLGYQYSANQHPPHKLMSSYQLGFRNIQEINESIDHWISCDYDNDPLFEYIQSHSASITNTHFVDINNLKSTDKKSEIIVEKYYDPYEIGEEITWSYKSDNSLFTINLCRHRSSERLTNSQKAFLTRISNLIVQSTIQHSKLLQLNDGIVPPLYIEHTIQPIECLPSEDRHVQIEKITNILTRLNLTYRESEICAYITQGYSSIAISLILNISINTIATHRKRAYAKLGISSQRELFSLIYTKKMI